MIKNFMNNETQKKLNNHITSCLVWFSVPNPNDTYIYKHIIIIIIIIIFNTSMSKHWSISITSKKCFHRSRKKE